MPKLKTHQGTAKRFRKTKTGKIMHRTSGQDHFNTRETGKVVKNKRRDSKLSPANNRIKALIVHK
ncbi:TPA: 50S ribosomal protein L35 [Patescibacteria group bacterium]|jgi:large subunit ribosomal protein L35|nr:50S ribosomal protein L35 [Patescibacteria group bacterium]